MEYYNSEHQNETKSRIIVEVIEKIPFTLFGTEESLFIELIPYKELFFMAVEKNLKEITEISNFNNWNHSRFYRFVEVSFPDNIGLKVFSYLCIFVNRLIFETISYLKMTEFKNKELLACIVFVATAFNNVNALKKIESYKVLPNVINCGHSSDNITPLQISNIKNKFDGNCINKIIKRNNGKYEAEFNVTELDNKEFKLPLIPCAGLKDATEFARLVSLHEFEKAKNFLDSFEAKTKMTVLNWKSISSGFTLAIDVILNSKDQKDREEILEFLTSIDGFKLKLFNNYWEQNLLDFAYEIEDNCLAEYIKNSS